MKLTHKTYRNSWVLNIATAGCCVLALVLFTGCPTSNPPDDNTNTNQNTNDNTGDTTQGEVIGLKLGFPVSALEQAISILYSAPTAASRVDAFYVPVTGGTSHDNLRAFLDGIDAIDPEIRLLGNGEWHGLSAATQAEQHQAVFTGDVEIGEDNPYYKDFSNRYEDVYGESPDTMALVGYDVMQYLVTTVKQIDVRSELLDALRNAERFEGVGRSIDFRAGNVNQAISFKSFKDGETIVQD